MPIENEEFKNHRTEDEFRYAKVVKFFQRNPTMWYTNEELIKETGLVCVEKFVDFSNTCKEGQFSRPIVRAERQEMIEHSWGPSCGTVYYFKHNPLYFLMMEKIKIKKKELMTWINLLRLTRCFKECPIDDKIEMIKGLYELNMLTKDEEEKVFNVINNLFFSQSDLRNRKIDKTEFPELDDYRWDNAFGDNLDIRQEHESYRRA